MYTKTIKLALIILWILPCLLIAQQNIGNFTKEEKKMAAIVAKKVKPTPWDFSMWRHTGRIVLDSIQVSKSQKCINFFFSPQLTHIPVRQAEMESIKQQIKYKLGRRFSAYTIHLYSRHQLVESYIPNYFRHSNLTKDEARNTIKATGIPVVTRLNQPNWEHGLTGRHIALWPGHGWYFEHSLDRWEWQRARLFQTVEDLYPYSITRQFLVPMLENAGANVFLPRERCTQAFEIVVDNDGSDNHSKLEINNGTFQWETVYNSGFAIRKTLIDGENPFKMGTHLKIKAGGNKPGSLFFIPDIIEDGEYGVYISWAETENSVEDVICRINYSGGQAEFKLNQKMGFGTWIYLGTYYFKKGVNKALGSIEITSTNHQDGFITADAVRFGGGMGNVARGIERSSSPMGLDIENKALLDRLNEPRTSGRPRFMEGARYFLQYSGMPDSIVYNLNKSSKDYNDDYMSRGEWVNYLMGSPNGPTLYRDARGLGIPIDLALSFHTDAGVTPNDSVIGTLAIYSTRERKGFFPNGKSRMASRDLSDIIQTQIIEDIKVKYNPRWTRRGLWDREYSEAWRPNTPVMLLELLSHQNMADMRFGLDPRFQFDIGRAIYKGMLRFINGYDAVVQPLPPSHMQIEFLEEKKIRISWQPVEDPLEATAKAEQYKVYQQTDGQGFDVGTLTTVNYLELELDEWSTIYGFRVTALNQGGESFPGETLSVALLPNQKPEVLIVNSFDRICGPSWFDTGKKAGIDWWEDEGVPYGIDYSKIGNQYDYNRQSKWLDDDSPGWGASQADLEGRPNPGNTFNFPMVHGRAFLNAGYSFVSISNEAFELLPNEKLTQYSVVDVIFGEQRGTASFIQPEVKDFRVFTEGLINKLEYITLNKGNLLISGAYIGTDMVENKDSLAINFAKNSLGFTWRTNQATNVGEAIATREGEMFLPVKINFITDYHPKLYKVEAPDAIEPFGKNAHRLYRYASNNSSAAIFYNGAHKAVTFGFPLETVYCENELNSLIESIMKLFKNKL